jgi:hypothetical protein
MRLLCIAVIVVIAGCGGGISDREHAQQAARELAGARKDLAKFWHVHEDVWEAQFKDGTCMAIHLDRYKDGSGDWAAFVPCG